MRYLCGIICLVVCWGAHSREPLTVIYDSGETLPLAPYLPKRAPKKSLNLHEKAAQSPFQLPITTPSMSPGEVTVTPKSLRYLQRPLFLVGADALSKEWLVEKREQLIQVGAVGLLIEAKDRSEVEDILVLSEGLRVIPASAEGFAAKLGLTHYPILLSKSGWEQ